MENNFTYKGYEIRITKHKRMAGGCLEGVPMYEVENTHYNIYKDGVLKSFCFDKKDLDLLIHEIENPQIYSKLGSRFD